MVNFRGVADYVSSVVGRSRLANVAGRSFGGKRDLYKALGYQRELFIQDYRSRFDRNAVANRIIKALPKATWRGGAEIIEDEDPQIETPFEQAFIDLDRRLKIWPKLQQTDILSGIGRFAGLVMGAPGDMSQPLLSAAADDIKYLRPYSEEDCKILRFDLDPLSSRYGQPEMYSLSRTPALSPDSSNSEMLGKQIHWTRVFHVADGLLDDAVYGEPRLKCVWNLLDDLEKVTGGGAEAFWRRADRGLQFDLDPDVEFEDEDLPGSTAATNPAQNESVKKQIDAYEHGLKKYLFTRGVKVKELGSDVADFAQPVNSIISQISAGTGIPQRVLMGSEQGKLAAKTDRSNWDDRVSDRRDDFATPLVVRPFVERLIQLGVLPKPEKGFDVRWPMMKILDDEQRSAIAAQWSAFNTAAGETVVTGDEIRDRVLNLPPLKASDKQAIQPKTPTVAMTGRKWRVMTREQRDFYQQKIGLRAAAALPEPPTKIRIVQRDRRGLVERFIETAEG